MILNFHTKQELWDLIGVAEKALLGFRYLSSPSVLFPAINYTVTYLQMA
jgi:hypothetical protein